MVSKLRLSDNAASSASMIYLDSINKLFGFVPSASGFIVDLADFSITTIAFQYPSYNVGQSLMSFTTKRYLETISGPCIPKLCFVYDTLILYFVGQPCFHAITFKGENITVSIANLPSSIRLVQVLSFIHQYELQITITRFLLLLPIECCLEIKMEEILIVFSSVSQENQVSNAFFVLFLYLLPTTKSLIKALYPTIYIF